jgi:hypothetical protein
MAHLASQADAIRRRVESADRLDALAERLNELGSVASVDRDPEHTPPAVVVTLRRPSVTEAVASALDAYDAVVDPASVFADGGGVGFRVTTPAQFEATGDREIRKDGRYSTRITFPRPTVDISGFDVGDSVSLYATEGAVLLVNSVGEQRRDGGGEADD